MTFSKWYDDINKATYNENFTYTIPSETNAGKVFGDATRFILNVVKFKYCYDREGIDDITAKSADKHSGLSFMITKDSINGKYEPIEMEFFEYPNMESLIPGLYFSSIEKAKLFADWANEGFPDDYLDYPIV